MSDIDPDLPEWLVDAVLDEQPPADAVDLVKQAWTWRTVDAELMELAYDSVLDEAGVRDASARRTMEFVLGDVSVVVEVDGLTVRVVVAGVEDPVVRLLGAGEPRAARREKFGDVTPGAYRVSIQVGEWSAQTPAFVVG